MILFSLGCTGSPKELTSSAGSALQLAQITYTVAVRSPAGVELVDVAIGVEAGIELGPDAAVTRANSTPSVLTSVGAGADGVTLLPRAFAGHVYSTSVVTLHPHAHLLGGIDAPSATLLPNAVVDGTVNTSPQLTPFEEGSFTVEFPQAEAANVNVAPHKSRELLPARYGQLKVAPHGKVVLRSGDYYLEKLTLQPGSRLELQQITGPTHLFVREVTKLGALISYSPTHRGFVLVQTEPSTVSVDAPFHGVIVAPSADLVLKNHGEPHRGAFFARSVRLGPNASVVYEAPNALVGLLVPPDRSLQACADAIRPREDVTGDERERLYQADIARYCSMAGAADCEIDLAGRANVDYTAAAAALVGETISPAEYLAIVRDRTRKRIAAEDDPDRAQALCLGQDGDDDWIPDDVDQCPNTPPLTPTDDVGCTDSTLPPAPAADDVRALFEHGGFMLHAACNGALMLPKIPAGAFYYPGDSSRGTYILSGRVTNQPDGCRVWYFFDIQELQGDQVVRRYSVAFFEEEEATGLVGLGMPVPGGFIQFNPRPGDPGTRGHLATVGGRMVRFRVRAMNGAGMRTDWSEWKVTTKTDCERLGFVCP